MRKTISDIIEETMNMLRRETEILHKQWQNAKVDWVTSKVLQFVLRFILWHEQLLDLCV